MTKEEYIKKQKDILERAIKDTFKVDPVKLMLVNRLLLNHKKIKINNQMQV